MANFKQDETPTATDMGRNVSETLKKAKSGKIKKAMILKNNKFEAVLISMSEFERLEKAVELLNILVKRQKNGN